MRKLAIATIAAAGLFAARHAAAAEMNLIFTTITLPNTPIVAMYHEWADKVNAAGKGVVHLDVRDGFNLVSSTNFYDRLNDDVVQVSFGSPNYVAGHMPLSQVMALPFLFKNSEEASVVYWRLYKTGMLDQEFDRIIPLVSQGFPQNSLHLVKAPTATLFDLKGLRIIAGGQTGNRMITALGATAMSLPLTDSYEGLSRGTADGMILPMAATHDFKIDEPTHYHIIAALGGAPGGIWIAKAKFESLPAEVRKILIDNSGEPASRRIGQLFDQLSDSVPSVIKAMPNETVTELTAEQSKKWQEAIAPVYASWDSADPKKGDAIVAKAREILAAVRTGH